MGKKILIFSLSIILLLQNFLTNVPLVYSSVPNCTDQDFAAGLDRAKTKLELNEQNDLQINVVTKTGQNCKMFFNIERRQNITVDEFANKNNLINLNSNYYAYSFGMAQMRPPYTDVDPIGIELFLIISERGLTKGGASAQFQGIFYQYKDGSRKKFYQASPDSWGLFLGLSERAKDRYREVFNLRGKSVEGGVIKKADVKINTDFSIDYTNSNVQEMKLTTKDWAGQKEELPEFTNQKMRMQIWKKGDGENVHIFYKNYTVNLTKNPSDGRFTITDELPVGEYVLTAFLEIEVFERAAERFLVSTIGDNNEVNHFKSSGENLESIISQVNTDTFYKIYLGVVNRGMADLFIAQSRFSVKEVEMNNISISPVFKHSASTRDVIGELVAGLVGDCSTLSLVFSGSFEKIVHTIMQCIIKYVIEPILDWAAQLVSGAAGISFFRQEKLITLKYNLRC